MKPYEKPTLLCEMLGCCDCLCACAVKASALESTQCGLVLEGTPYTIFLETWQACLLSADNAPVPGLERYCYQPGEQNLFSS